MKRLSWIAIAPALLFGCGDDGLPQVPERMERETPAFVAPGPVTEFWDGGGPDISVGPEVECCDVRFAIATDPDVREIAARLMGERAPIAAGVEMTRDGDEWSVSACMPLTYGGSYHYEVDLQADDGVGVFTETRTNPNAQIAASSFGGVNLFPEMTDCGEVGSHSDTSAVD